MKFDLKNIKSGARYVDPRYYIHLIENSDDKDFYKAFLTEQFILRDHLAIDRTMLANESTFLAYIRTGLAMAAAGATVIHFATEQLADTGGCILLAGGIVTFLIGVIRYRAMKKTISTIRHHHEEGDLEHLKDSTEHI